jgi:hypothetical protein
MEQLAAVTAALGSAAGFRGTAGRFRSTASGFRSTASRLTAALAAAVTMEQLAAVTAALRGAARGGRTARGLWRAAGRLNRGAARRLRRTTRRLTTAAKQAGFRLRGGKNKQAGKQQRRQHDPGFHDGTPKQKLTGIPFLLRSRPYASGALVCEVSGRPRVRLLDAFTRKASLLVIVDAVRAA